MSVTTTDGRSKAVYNKLVDKFSTNYPLSNLLTDAAGLAAGPVRANESIDIPTRSAVQIAQVSDANGSILQTIQSITPTANNLKVDKHYGGSVEIPKLQAIFDLEGAWSTQLADGIRIEMDDYVDRDLYDAIIRVGAYASDASFWMNVASDAISEDDTENALAKMLSQKGVRMDGLAWVFHPFGMGSVRRISAFAPAGIKAEAGALGLPAVGTLHNIPVVVNQSVPTSLAVVASASNIASNVCTYTVPSGHGFVPGMLITTSGFTADITVAVAISSVTATTIVAARTGSNGSNGVGTITTAMCCNSLVHRPWMFRRIQQVPDVRVVPRQLRPGADELQFDSVWGKTVLAGATVGLGSPASAVA